MGNDWSSCCKYSVLISNCSEECLSSPDPKIGESSDIGKFFWGLLATSLEVDHGSSALPIFARPKTGSSLLQNHHLVRILCQMDTIVYKRTKTKTKNKNK